jgi:hypothetical protein
MAEKIDFISFKTLRNRTRTVEIHTGFHTHFKKEKSGNYSFHIPCFGIFFGASSLEEGKERRSILLNSYLDFWVHKQGLNKFALELHRLGFRAASHNVVMGEMIKRKGAKIINAKFKINTTKPSGDFEHAESIQQDFKIAV